MMSEGQLDIKALPLLQNHMKKDPESYKDNFENAYKEFNDLWTIFLLSPSCHEEKLISIVMFLAQVVHCYKESVEIFSSQLMSVLSKHGPQLDADMRLTFCKAIILMRNRNLISPIAILKLFFHLFRCSDNILRETLKNYIIQDIKKVNKKSKCVSLNSELQNFMFPMLKDGNILASKTCLDIIIDLFHRKIWNDVKTANIISTALFSKSNKIVVAALKFFIGSEQDDGGASDSDDEAAPKERRSSKQLQLAYRVGKKTNKREKRMNRALDMVQNQKKKRKKVNTTFSAIYLLNDPQEIGERVFVRLMKPNVNDLFNVKVMKLNFISQLIGIHKLILLSFYPYFDRYLKPSQRDVVKLLLFLAQACHDLVPPDIILSTMKSIAYNFISERNSNEVIAVGLNAIREICNRSPFSMDVDLLHDLALYKKHKDKCVSVAAQSLIGLFRSKNPQLLHKSFQGKPTVAMAEKKALDFGELDAKDYLPGAEILPDEEDLQKKGEKDKEADEWESCSEDDDADSSGSWVDVSHSSDEEENEELNKVREMTKEEKVEKSRKIMESRILTEDEIKKVQAYQQSKETEFAKKGKGEKRPHSVAFSEESGELLSLASIENVHKKRRHDKDSRIASVMAGREDRAKYGARKGRANEHASTSNKEKERNKNFIMIRQKVLRKKNKATFHDKKVDIFV